MKKLALLFGLVGMMVSSALAWQPEGWVYLNYPYAYDRGSDEWNWLSTADTLWVNGFTAGVGRYQYNHPGGYSSSSSVSTDGGTAKVGSYLPNSWGLYDMHGNAAEWCLDWYQSCHTATLDPVGAASGASRVRRGDSWSRGARNCRSAKRSGGGYPGIRYYSVGGGSPFFFGFRLSGTLP